MFLNLYRKHKRLEFKIIASLAIMIFLLDAQFVYSQTNSQNKNSAQLQARIKQLEAQVSDLQVIIGTLESLVKQGGATARSSAAGSNTASGGFGVQAGGGARLADRIEGLETQIRAISGQLERLAANVDNLNRNSASGSFGRQGVAGDSQVYPGQNSGERIVSRELQDPNNLTTQSYTSGFGSLSVESNGRSNGLTGPGSINSNGQGGISGQRNSRDRVASLGNESPKEIYDAAYGHLLSRDYASAESTFKEFLKRYPNDRLAGNAQYWLGESFYVRGNYRKAADNFLKGYSKYRKNRKAPESLLKLAMSLKKLGQKDAACATFDELNAKFPKMEPRVKQRADFEQRGAGC